MCVKNVESENSFLYFFVSIIILGRVKNFLSSSVQYVTTKLQNELNQLEFPQHLLLLL